MEQSIWFLSPIPFKLLLPLRHVVIVQEVAFNFQRPTVAYIGRDASASKEVCSHKQVLRGRAGLSGKPTIPITLVHQNYQEI